MNTSTRKNIEKKFGKVKIFKDGFPVSKARYEGPSGMVRPVVQEKPWGAEVWLVFTHRYAFKVLFIEKGNRFSLQKHRKKEESWFIAQGVPVVTINGKAVAAKPGNIIHVRPNTIHRIEARDSSCEIWEVSTPELSDVVRIADDFARMIRR